MRVPLLDLKRQFECVESDVRKAIDRVLTSQQFIMGPSVVACEESIASYCDAAYGIGVSSGSDALLVSLMGAGVGPGDEVITTPFTFFATVGAIVRLGATPVFADIDPCTFNVNPDLVAKAVTDKTKAIIAVHLYGNAEGLCALRAICDKHGLILVEDAAQALGAKDGDRRAGAVGDYACLSFFPSKNLGAIGDGGMVLVQAENTRDVVQSLRMHGASPKYYHQRVGGNFRLDAIQAEVIHAKLKYLEGWHQARNTHAVFYDKALAGIKGVVTPPRRGGRHVYNQYVIRAHDRDALQAALTSAEIQTAVYYPVPMHLQACFSDLGYGEGDFPEAERAAQEVLAIPLHPDLEQAQLDYVADKIRAFYPTS